MNKLRPQTIKYGTQIEGEKDDSDLLLLFNPVSWDSSPTSVLFTHLKLVNHLD